MWADKAKVGRSAVVILQTLTSLLWFSSYFAFLSVSTRNVLPDFGSEVMAEALAQRALVKPVYTIPIIPLSSSNQYRHQDHLDMKDYKKVRTCSSGIVQKTPHFPPFSSVCVCVETEWQANYGKLYWLWIRPLVESIHSSCLMLYSVLTHWVIPDLGIFILKGCMVRNDN